MITGYAVGMGCGTLEEYAWGMRHLLESGTKHTYTPHMRMYMISCNLLFRKLPSHNG